MDQMKLQYEPNAFYRWSPKGDTPVQKFARSKDQQVSFYGGLSYQTKKQMVMLSQKQNSQETIRYFEQIKKRYQAEIQARQSELEQLRRQKEQVKVGDDQYRGLILVVLDGASYHHSKEVKAWLDDNYGILELMRFPTYSPDLNPEEKVWKSLRRYLSSVAGQYSFKEMVDRSCRFLLTQTFDYKFV